MFNSIELEPISLETSDHEEIYHTQTAENKEIVAKLFNDILSLYKKYPKYGNNKFRVIHNKLKDGLLSHFLVTLSNSLLNQKPLFEIKFWLKKPLLQRAGLHTFDVVGEIVGKSPYSHFEKDAVLSRLFLEHIVPHFDKLISDPSWNSNYNTLIPQLHFYSERLAVHPELKQYWKASKNDIIFDAYEYREQMNLLREYIRNNNIQLSGTLKPSP